MKFDVSFHKRFIMTLGIVVALYKDEDTTATELFVATGSLMWIWGDVALARVSTGVMWPVYGVVVAGGVASYAIAGKSGVDDYIDFLTEGMAEEMIVTGDLPEEYLEVVVPAIEAEVVEPAIEWGKGKVREAEAYAHTVYRTLRRNLGLGWRISNPLF